MKYKTSELEGALLDAAVAECLFLDDRIYRWVLIPETLSKICRTYFDGAQWEPSTDWVDGGPIIEIKRISLDSAPDSDPSRPWKAWIGRDYCYGQTALIAAMRCYVSSRFGEEVELK